MLYMNYIYGLYISCLNYVLPYIGFKERRCDKCQNIFYTTSGILYVR